MNMYVFFIETFDEQRIEWRRLSLRQVQSMNAWTENNLPDNVKCYGWEKQEWEVIK